MAKTDMPQDVEPMLATLVAKPPAGEWLYEVKWDGFRALAYMAGDEVRIRSRNNKDFTAKYYPITAALKAWRLNAVVDGELVVLDANGHPDFGALQRWRSETDGALAYYIFDLLWTDGRNVTGEAFTVRRNLLRKAMRSLPANGMIRLSEEFSVPGKEMFARAEALDLEGVMAKDPAGTYAPGARSKAWLKVKVEKRQEAVIGGYTLNEGSDNIFSALLTGVYRKGKFEFLTPVGTGFSQRTQEELVQRLAPLVIKTCPFTKVPDFNIPSRFRPDPPKASVTWVRPEVVVELAYRELTRDGAVRHPSFKGLREDKDPKSVVMELPKKVDMKKKTATRKAASRKAATTKEAKKATPAKKRLIKPPASLGRKSLLNPSEATQTKMVNGEELSFTNLDKVYWPKKGYTKRDMLNYYYRMAEVMLPYYKDRPQTLNRYPNGIDGKTFYQKDVKGKVPEWVETYPYYSEADKQEKEFMVVNNEASILYIASLGCIEINPWSSKAASPDNPDWCIIDLDPDRTTFGQVIEAAQVTRKVLDAIGVESCPKTSGSTGIHIYVPLKAKYDYEASKEFARMIATIVHEELPKTTSIERMIAKRGHRMYIDFLQNRPQATVAGPYSLRPKPGAPVSMPLDWSEVKKGLKITDHNITNAVARVKDVGDLFKPVLGKGIDLKKVLKAAKRVFDKQAKVDL